MLEKFRNALPRRGRQNPQQAGPQQAGPQPAGKHRLGLHRVGLHRVKDRLSQLKPAEAIRYGLDDLNTLRRQVTDSDVIRHRRTGSPLRRQFRAQVAGRRRTLVAVAAALSMVGVATVAANAAVNDPPPVEASQQLADARAAIAERQAASERTDRSDRDSASRDDDSRDGGQSRGSNPEESPRPSDDERENEDSANDDSSGDEPGDEPTQEPAEESAPAEPESAPEPKPDWTHPMPGASTTSCYGMRWGAMHAGVDLAAPEGTPIKAVGAGTVTEAGWAFGGYGISVVIDHGDGHFTHYAHASQAKVSVGDKVSPGQTIALEGNTGDSTGPHLHFEVHKGMWNQVEPTAWMNNRGVNIGGC